MRENWLRTLMGRLCRKRPVRVEKRRIVIIKFETERDFQKCNKTKMGQ